VKSTSSAAAFALALAFMLPSLGRAQLILDTGTPTGTTNYVISTASSIEGEFAATTGEKVTQLSAYLTNPPGDNYAGDFFTFNIYSGLRTTGNRITPVFTTTATYSGNGWNTATGLNYTFPATGDYWLAIQGSSTGITYDAPSSSNTGTVPALAFASSSTSSNYYTTGTTDIGLRVTVAPEPSTWTMLLGGLALLAFWGCRARRA
jgi:hypothetical protein